MIVFLRLSAKVIFRPQIEWWGGHTVFGLCVHLSIHPSVRLAVVLYQNNYPLSSYKVIPFNIHGNKQQPKKPRKLYLPKKSNKVIEKKMGLLYRILMLYFTITSFLPCFRMEPSVRSENAFCWSEDWFRSATSLFHKHINIFYYWLSRLAVTLVKAIASCQCGKDLIFVISRWVFYKYSCFCP